MEVGNEQTWGLQSGKLFPTKRVCSLVDEILLRGTAYGGLPLHLEESRAAERVHAQVEE